MSKDDDKNNQSENQQAKDSDGQVIQFPLERLKAQRKAKRLANKNKQQKVTLFLSVASIFIFAAYMNQQTGSSLQEVVQKQGMERMVANSEVDNSEIADKNRELAESLDESTQRVPASYGRKPSALEKLKFEKLRGRYRIAYNEANYLMEISLDNSGGVKQKPIYIGTPEKFLSEHKDLIASGYEYTEFIKEERLDTEEVVKHYSLHSDQGLEVGQAHLKFNKFGAFIQLLVEEYRQPASE